MSKVANVNCPASHPYDCDGVLHHNKTQRGYCVKEKEQCFKPFELNEDVRYRTRKLHGSVWIKKKRKKKTANVDETNVDSTEENADGTVDNAADSTEAANVDVDGTADSTEAANADGTADSTEAANVDGGTEAASAEADVDGVKEASADGTIEEVNADVTEEGVSDASKAEYKQLQESTLTTKGRVRAAAIKQMLASRKQKKAELRKYFKEQQANINRQHNELFIKKVRQLLDTPIEKRAYAPVLRMIDVNAHIVGTERATDVANMVNVNHVNGDGMTAMDMAIAANDYKLRNFLDHRGAKTAEQLSNKAKDGGLSAEGQLLRDVPDVQNYPDEWTTGFQPGQNGLAVPKRYERLPGNLECDGETSTFVPYFQHLLKQYVVDKNIATNEWMATCGAGPGDTKYPPTIKKGERMPFPSQKIFKWAMHPLSPVKRMLAIHTAGAGKTNMIADALSNYFTDPRAKIVVVPTQQLVLNIYTDLLKMQDHSMVRFLERPKYRHLLEGVRNPKSAEAKNQALIDIIGLFECKPPNPNPSRVPRVPLKYQKKPGPDGAFRKSDNASNDDALCAPIRVYSLKEFCVNVGKLKNNQNADAFAFNWGNVDPTKSPLTNHILLIDEVHNLINPLPEFFEGNDYNVEPRVDHWKRTLIEIEEAQNAVVVGFTATPIGRSATINSEKQEDMAVVKKAQSRCKYYASKNANCPVWSKAPLSDARRLFNLVKGKENERANDKGFVSYYMQGMVDLFARTVPSMQDLLESDGSGGRYGVEYVPMPPANVEGTGKHYATRRGKCSGKATQMQCQWAHNFNDDIRPSQGNIIGPKGTDLSPKGSLATRRAKLTGDRLKYNAPKVHRAIELIREHERTNPDEKVLILANEESGFHLLAFVLFEQKIPFIGIYAKNKNDTPVGCQYLYDAKGFHKYSDKLSVSDIESRDNTPASECRVVMLNTDKYSEGVSVKNTTLTICLSPIDNWSTYRQAFARGVRSCGHYLFDKKDRLVKIRVLVGTNEVSPEAAGGATEERRQAEEDGGADVSSMSVPELKSLCKQRGLSPPGGCSKLTKSKLKELLQPAGPAKGGAGKVTVGTEPTIDEQNLEKAIKDKPIIEAQLCWFKGNAFDAEVLHPFTQDTMCEASSAAVGSSGLPKSNAKRCPTSLFTGRDDVDDGAACLDWCKDEPRMYIKGDLRECIEGHEAFKKSMKDKYFFKTMHLAKSALPGAINRKTLQSRRKDLAQKLREGKGKYTYKQYKQDYSKLFDEEYAETEAELQSSKASKAWLSALKPSTSLQRDLQKHRDTAYTALTARTLHKA